MSSKFNRLLLVGTSLLTLGGGALAYHGTLPSFSQPDVATVAAAAVEEDEQLRIDVTDTYIVNAGCTYDGGGWSNSNFSGYQSNTTYTNGDVSIGPLFLETWTGWSTLSDGYLKQSVNLPAGFYTLEVDAIASNQYSGESVTGVNLFADGGEKQVTAMGSNSGEPRHFRVDFAVSSEEATELGIELSNTNANWVVVDNFKLYQYVSEEDYKDYMYQQALAKAKEELAISIYWANNFGANTSEVAAILENPESTCEMLEAANHELKKQLATVMENDSQYPWTMSSDGEYIGNGNKGKSYSASSLKCTFDLQAKTELSFDWLCYNYSSHSLELYIDGVYNRKTTSSDYSRQRLYLSSGTHVIEFRDTIGNSTSTSNYSRIKNIKVKNLETIAEEVLAENSLPITFVNDDTFPWTPEDGYIKSSNYGTQNSASNLWATVTVDAPTMLSFNTRVRAFWTSEGYHTLVFSINGEKYSSVSNEWSWNSMADVYSAPSVVLPAGKYDLMWSAKINSTSNECYTQLSNIELNDNWIEVEVSTPGTLGVEVLYLVNVLKDIELLKVKGTINDTDWGNIKQMTNLAGIDLSEAKFNSVPSYAFDGLSRLSYCVLPEGMTSIGSYAFRGTQIWDIAIPSSVTRIGTSAFADTRVRAVTFKEDSQLETIYYRAFYNCTSLKEFIMPNTVTSLRSSNGTNYWDYDADTFRGCTSLKKLYFSDALWCIPRSTCYDCTALTDVKLPKDCSNIYHYAFRNTTGLNKIKFPESLQSVDYQSFCNSRLDSVVLPVKLTNISEYAFSDNSNLKYVELPSYISSYNRNFTNCSNIKTVVCKSATPPSISNDPLSSVSKSGATLYVPSFAVANYKLDKYWYQFGNIQELDADLDLDYWRIAGNLMLTNNRRMGGKPAIDIYYGSQLTVSGNAPMEVTDMNVYVSEGNPSRLLNNCDAFTADNITTIFNVSANTWYFFTPLHDTRIMDVTHSAGASYVFRYYNGQQRATSGTGNSWQNVSDGMLRAGQGYIFQCNAAGDVIMPAIKETQDVIFNSAEVVKELATYESDNSANRSWNYVGNPYPCYYDIYYMDFTAPITIREGSNYYAKSIVDDNYVLRPMQSFFVQKPDAVDNIIFRPEGRQLSSTVNRASYAPAMRHVAAKDARLVFDIDVVQGESYDRTRIVLNEGSSVAYEVECDAAKFMSDDPTMAQVFTMVGETRMAINERPCASGIIALGITTGEAGTYTITSPRHDAAVYLHDAVTGMTVDLGVEDYTFTTDGAQEMMSRFTLTFDDTATSIAGAAASQGKVAATAGALGVEVPDGSEVLVYNAGGALVASSSKSATFTLPAGIYVVKINGNTTKAIVR